MIDLLYNGWFSIIPHWKVVLFYTIVLSIFLFNLKTIVGIVKKIVWPSFFGVLYVILLISTVLLEVILTILAKFNISVVGAKYDQFTAKQLNDLKERIKKKYNTSEKLNWFKLNKVKTLIVVGITLLIALNKLEETKAVEVVYQGELWIFTHVFERPVLSIEVAHAQLAAHPWVAFVGEDNIEPIETEETKYLQLVSELEIGNVRQEPNLEADIIESIYPNDQLIYLNEMVQETSSRTWYLVQLPNGVKGWVSSKIAQPINL